MGREPTEADLLLPIESEKLRGDYKEYFKVKRNNFFGTIQKFPGIWRCFLLLDEIWMREFADLEHLCDPNQMFPGTLFMNAHAKIRVAFELAFSCCLGEAWDILRGAIESFAHGHKLIREPHLLNVWIEKDNGKREAEAFKGVFERHRKANLFPSRHGLGRLHEYWCNFSEWGTHTTVASMAQRFESRETSADVEWRLNYTGADPVLSATSLMSMLCASNLMVEGVFGCFRARLQFDNSLINMRTEFQKQMVQLSKVLIKQFRLKPPAIWP